MALTDPVAVYVAENDVEAHLLRDLLAAAGVEAVDGENASQAEKWVGGMIADTQTCQVWVGRADAERARPVLEAYERRAAERRAAARAAEASGPPVEAVCEECGKPAAFPAAQRGSVQECPHCGAFVDVGEEELPEGWADEPGEEESEAG
jgi:hypothetical protein